MNDITPTPEDMARDLRADLAYCAQFPLTGPNLPRWIPGWSAALRRALAAEDRLAELKIPHQEAGQ